DVIVNHGIISSGKVNIVSNNPSVVADSDVILFTVPSFAKSKILKEISPFIKENAILGSFPGSGGFNWEVDKFIKKNILVFSSQRVPYISRIIEKGKSVNAVKKDSISIVTTKGAETRIKILLEDILNIKVVLLDDFLEVNLSNSNPILHTSRLYSIFKNYKNNNYYKENVLFYEDWDINSSDMLIAMDREFMLLINKIGLKGIKSLKVHYEVNDSFEMTKKLSSIDAFKNIYAPMIKKNKMYCLDFSSRYFTEDVDYGLIIIKWFAQNLNIKTPSIDIVLKWYQKLVSENILDADGYLSKTYFEKIKDLTNNYFNSK
ncbi:MAG: NAD/NADP octopine/nopaline dehydrogenase family protein, partial [Flavobacteriales bacterium]|nr:NAD/NADP octopine/nopaline dehydrogenase family protein [Flavobacteriales bacterium]